MSMALSGTFSGAGSAGGALTRTLRSVLNAQAVDALRARVRAEVDDGHSLAAQFALGMHGEIVGADSFGTARPDSRFVIFSATKTIVAMALLPHLADGSIELTAPVARYLPEFGGERQGRRHRLCSCSRCRAASRRP